ncbi:MAG: 50S ribosomal protein L10 [Candidatus Hydrothermarchaeota archaeon]|nr:50S ribosomal protein L10 [Candidatus Hydrothermarchaeota archaeon]
MPHVAKWKYEEVDSLKDLLLKYPVIGVVNMGGIPARQLQKMRKLLKGEVLIKMSKKSLMLHALEKASKEERSLQSLAGHIGGQPAFIFSKMNPFKLYKILEKNRANAPAKPESIAPKDIMVPKGETPFPPGPLLGELQQVGIPATVKEGKIAIKEDKIVVRQGEKISPKLALALARLGIEPMEIGIALLAAYEKGTVFLPELLAVNEDKTIAELKQAYQQALNLSLNAGYVTKGNVELAIGKAFRDAKALAAEANIFEPEVVKDILSKAHLQMLSLKTLIEKKR